MNIFKSGFGIVLVMLTVVAMMGAACGPQETPPPSLPPTPSGNQPPVISSLVAENMQLYPSGNTEIQCIAQDADGDQLDFKWACTGGSSAVPVPSLSGRLRRITGLIPSRSLWRTARVVRRRLVYP